MIEECCKTCGQTLPRKKFCGMHFRGNRRKIIERIQKSGKHGVQTQRLYDLLYADKADGGPDTLNIIHIYVCQMNKALKKEGWRIKNLTPGGGPGMQATYALEPLK